MKLIFQDEDIRVWEDSKEWLVENQDGKILKSRNLPIYFFGYWIMCIDEKIRVLRECKSILDPFDTLF